MITDNIPKEKTAEQVELERKEALEAKKKSFAENPDRFVDLTTLLIAVLIKEDGDLAFLLNPGKRSQFLLAQGEMNYRIHQHLGLMEFAARKAQQEKDKIVVPKQPFYKGAVGRNR